MRLFTAGVTLSLALVLAGFLYDVYFAGIPYQDPTPELQSRWAFHKGVSKTMMLAGAIGFALVALAALMVGLRRRRTRADP